MPGAPAGPIRFEVRRGRPYLGEDLDFERQLVRRERELAPVNAAADSSSSRPVYWTFADVARRDDRARLTAAPVMYDLTFVSPRPLGQERPRTHGHVHGQAGEGGVGFAEVYEVLAGRAGLLAQDLRPGPEASFVLLVEAGVGEVVVLPPGIYHATLNLGSSMLVVADLVCRSATDEYATLRAAGGMAYGINVDGQVARNPKYLRVPRLQRVSAKAWDASLEGGLYERFVRDPGDFAWLCDPAAFAARFPELARRVC